MSTRNELIANIRNIDSTITGLSTMRKADLETMLSELRGQRSADLSAHYAPKAAQRLRAATGFAGIAVHKTATAWTVDLEGQTLWSGVRLDHLVAAAEQRPEACSKWLIAATL